MEFRLIYRGQLLPSANQPRPEEAHEIRRKIHPQLKRLWQTKKSLLQLAASEGIEAAKFDPEQYQNPDKEIPWWQIGLTAIGRKWNRGEFDFVPLVTSEIVLRCSLDILLLRPEGRNFIFKQGDIDGQLKTLFDGLSVPRHLQQVAKIKVPPDEKPMYCLLEDDNLVSEVRVTTDQLLMLPDEREVRPNDAFATIHVRVNHVGNREYDRWFD